MAYVHDGYWYIVRDGEHVSVYRVGTEEHVEIPLDVFDAVAEMRHAQLQQECPPHANLLTICQRFQTLGSEALRASCGLPSLWDENGESE